MKKVLLGTTGLVAAGAIAGSAMAAEISVGGALDLRISGFSDFEYEYIDSDLPDATNGRESFFNQDHEIIFRATGVGDATGITYGVNLELELTTGQNTNGTDAGWDEAWTFIKGGFGEFRFGNEDTAVDILKIGGHFNNRGTGGLDGAQRTARTIRPTDHGEATKILYFTPNIAGFQAGASYAFNASDKGSTAGTKNAIQDAFDVGANWRGSFSGVDLGVFAGLTSWTPGNTATDQDRQYNYMVGGLVGYGGISLALGYIDNDDASGIDASFNVGIGGEIGGVGLSFAYQNDDGNVSAADADYYVLSADTAILPGVALRGDIGYLDADQEDGVNALIQLRTLF